MGNISAPLGRGSIYTAPFSSVVISTAGSWDLLTLTAPSNSRVAILEIRLGQYTQFGDAKAGVQSLQIMTGSTATSTGAAITPLNVDGHTGASTGKTAVSGPTTGILSTSSSVVRLADAWNVAAGWFYSRPSFVPQMAIILKTSETMNLRMLTPNEALTMNATITFQEIGL
jgi:hypothetical protein